MNENQIAPTAWQQRCLEIPEAWSIASLGGRAGGKTFGAALIAVRHISLYGGGAKVLVVRENYLGLQQISETIVGILEKAFPGRVNYNPHRWWRWWHLRICADRRPCFDQQDEWARVHAPDRGRMRPAQGVALGDDVKIEPEVAAQHSASHRTDRKRRVLPTQSFV
jgi:hypothetical protein